MWKHSKKKHFQYFFLVFPNRKIINSLRKSILVMSMKKPHVPHSTLRELFEYEGR